MYTDYDTCGSTHISSASSVSLLPAHIETSATLSPGAYRSAPLK